MITSKPSGAQEVHNYDHDGDRCLALRAKSMSNCQIIFLPTYIKDFPLFKLKTPTLGKGNLLFLTQLYGIYMTHTCTLNKLCVPLESVKQWKNSTKIGFCKMRVCRSDKFRSHCKISGRSAYEGMLQWSMGFSEASAHFLFSSWKGFFSSVQQCRSGLFTLGTDFIGMKIRDKLSKF